MRGVMLGCLALVVGACGEDGDLRTADAGGGVDAGAVVDGAPDPDAGSRDPAAVEWVMREPPAEGPLRVWGFVVADLGGGRAVLFGGTTASEFSGTTLDGTYLYDMRGDTPVVTEMDATGPEPRYCGCATYDSDRNVVLLVGGRNVTTPLSIPPETWELDLSTETWSEADVPETPSGVIGCGLAYSRAAGHAVLFGGAGADGHPDTTWRYDPAAPAWVALDARGPVGRYDMVLRPMNDGRRLLMFAGSVGAMGSAFYSDVWIFDAVEEQWTELAVDGEAPPGRRTPWSAWAPGQRGLYVANGYDGNMEPIDDLWHLDLETLRWTELSVDRAPGPRGFSQPLPALDGTLGVMLAGFDGSAPVGEMWVLRSK